MVWHSSLSRHLIWIMIFGDDAPPTMLNLKSHKGWVLWQTAVQSQSECASSKQIKVEKKNRTLWSDWPKLTKYVIRYNPLSSTFCLLKIHTQRHMHALYFWTEVAVVCRYMYFSGGCDSTYPFRHCCANANEHRKYLLSTNVPCSFYSCQCSKFNMNWNRYSFEIQHLDHEISTRNPFNYRNTRVNVSPHFERD